MIGVDEVGRGCLAGPLLVVAARARGRLPAGLKDSKLLTRKQREEMLNGLSDCCSFGEGWVKASEIDRYGLAAGLRLGVRRALVNLKAEIHEEIVMDGNVDYIPKKFIRRQVMIDADNLVPIVSAASIHAKVRRDGFMAELARRHPAYSFERHVGYGTKNHMFALKSYGALKYIHRHSFLPISQLSGEIPSKLPNRV